MSLPKSSCVCLPCFKYVAPCDCLYYFFLTDMKTEVGVFVYTCTSNIPQIILILNIYGFMAMTP